jgi:rhodanese-related sulfurtransferase
MAVSVVTIIRALAIMVLFFLGRAAIAEEIVISAPEASALVAQGKLILVDIRTPDEWRQTGVPVGAKRVDFYNRNGMAAFLDQFATTVGPDKSVPIGIICRTGNRSTQAQKLLMAQGFTKIVNVREGMMGSDAGPGWLKRGLPVVACPTC